MTPEDAIDEYLTAAAEAAAEGQLLFGAEVHDTVYSTISDFGFRLSDCESDPAPLPEGDGMDEFDAQLTLVCFSRVAGQDRTDRKAARDKARALMLAAAQLFFDDTTAGGRVRDVLVGRCRRGFDTEGDDIYAVVNMPLTINGTGQLIDEE